MMSRRALAITVLTGSLIAVAPGPVDASHRRSGCPVKGKVHVFEKGRSIFACYSRFRHGRVRLGRSGRGGKNPDRRTVGQVHVAGGYVAWTIRKEPISSTGPFDTTDLHLAYVPRSRRIDVGPAGCPPRESSDGNVITSLVLNYRGLLGWVCWTESGLTEVHKYDASGPGLLDAGISDISLYDLALPENGTILYWFRSDGPRAAVLRF
jgi:hypothetical protein